jgi:hypothetical protein
MRRIAATPVCRVCKRDGVCGKRNQTAAFIYTLFTLSRAVPSWGARSHKRPFPATVHAPLRPTTTSLGPRCRNVRFPAASRPRDLRVALGVLPVPHVALGAWQEASRMWATRARWKAPRPFRPTRVSRLVRRPAGAPNACRTLVLRESVRRFRRADSAKRPVWDSRSQPQSLLQSRQCRAQLAQ